MNILIKAKREQTTGFLFVVRNKKKYNRSEKHFTIPVFFSSIQSKNFQEWWAVYSRIKKKELSLETSPV